MEMLRQLGGIMSDRGDDDDDGAGGGDDGAGGGDEDAQSVQSIGRGPWDIQRALRVDIVELRSGGGQRSNRWGRMQRIDGERNGESVCGCGGAGRRGAGFGPATRCPLSL